jgi:Iap family predicted aminopeptidase
MAGLSDIERRILGEAYSSPEAMRNLTVLCDEYGGRFAGTPESRGAAEYMLGKFEEYDFEDPHLESFTFNGCKVGPSTLEILEPIRRKISCLTLPMTASGDVEGDLVYVDGETRVDVDELAGKIVLGPTRLPFIRGADTDVGGFIWTHPWPALGPPTGCLNSNIPGVSVKHEDGAMLRRLLKRHGDIRVRVTGECDVFERESWNVCGEIPGNGSSDEFVLFGGHYDGHEIAQAAFDCGAPCAAVTEMGRVLNQERKHLDRSLRIVLFSAEEFGCWGSQDYVKRHRDEMNDLRFTYQLDCSGGGGTQMVTVDHWPELEPFYRRLSADLELPIPFDQRRGPGDSRAFFDIGIPTGSIIDERKQGMLELLKTYRHTVYDTLDKIGPRSLKEVVAIGAVSGYRIMNAESWPAHRGPDEVANLKKRTL